MKFADDVGMDKKEKTKKKENIDACLWCFFFNFIFFLKPVVPICEWIRDMMKKKIRKQKIHDKFLVVIIFFFFKQQYFFFC